MRRRNHPLVERVAGTIRSCEMLSPGERVLAAVSGGPDSVAMMHALVELAPRWRMQLVAGHVDHGTRGQASARDARWVAREAGQVGIPCIVERMIVAKERASSSWEEAARLARYRALGRMASQAGARVVALGHHAGDQAETVLMWMARGAGPEGLAGMAPVNARLPVGGGTARVIRPMIECTRADIMDYLTILNIRPRHDTTNTDEQYVRNRIRRTILPFLERRLHPGVGRRLAILARLAHDEQIWLEKVVRRASGRVLKCTEGRWSCDRAALLTQPMALQRRLVRRLIESAAGDVRGISFEHVEAVRRLSNAPGPGRLDLPHGIRIEARRERLTVNTT